MFFFSRFQIKKRLLNKIKKKNLFFLKWRNNPYFNIKRPQYLPRRLIVRLKHRRYKPRYVKKSTSKNKKKKNKRGKKFAVRLRKQKKNKKKLAFSKQIPSRSKFSHSFKGKNRSDLNYCKWTGLLNFGLSGLQVLKSTRLSAKSLYESIQIIRRLILKRKKIKGKRRQKDIYWWNYSLANVAVSKKPNEIRMGKGKGPVKIWINRCYRGKLLLEVFKNKSKKVLFSFDLFSRRICRPVYTVFYSSRKWKKIF